MDITSKDKITGMFFGIAIGDALGMPAENLPLEEKNKKYGRITTYVRPDGHKWFNGREAGAWTDDTQLTLLVADSLMEHKKLNLDNLSKRHVEYWKREGDLGFGSTTRTAIKKLEAGMHWSQSGKSNNPKHGFGNALPMKVSPIGALRASPFWLDQWIEWKSEFIDNIVELALMTHYKRMAIDSALAHVFAINQCLSDNFSVKNFLEETCRWSDFVIYTEIPPLKNRLYDRFDMLTKIGPESLTTEQIIKIFDGGTSYVYSSLPFSYAFFLRNPYSIETLYEVANAGGDTDTNTSIVGGLLGATNGTSIFPQHLIDGLWQKEQILATADKFYKTFFEEKKDLPAHKAMEGEGEKPMQVIYYYDDPPEFFSKSLFLAGPSPRTPDVKSWRPEALRILEEKGYDGVVYVPEQKPGDKFQFNEDDWRIKAPAWEHKMLDRSDIVLFWIPRNLATLPGFTTNVEFGHWINSGKAILGHPIEAPQTNYLKIMADKFHVPILWTLESTIDKALELVGDGALRTGGEREIPLFLWNTPSFQLWYQSHKKAGNRLDGVKVYWTFKVGPKKDKVFYWAIHPNIYITSEDRNKTNEAVISRFDISSVVLYKRRPNILDSEIVLVREFRSPVRNDSGFVWELPGGSSPNNADPLQTIVEETSEEVGLDLDKSRFNYTGSRQMAATMSTHHGILYSVELTDEEFKWLKSQKGIPHGADYPDKPTGERSYTEIVTLTEVLSNNLVDWSNVGMILSVLQLP